MPHLKVQIRSTNTNTHEAKTQQGEIVIALANGDENGNDKQLIDADTQQTNGGSQQRHDANVTIPGRNDMNGHAISARKSRKIKEMRDESGDKVPTSKTGDRTKQGGSDKKRRRMSLLSTMCIAIGVLMLAWPVALDLMSTARLSSVSTGISSAQDGYENPMELADAQAYNARLGGYVMPDGWDSNQTSDYTHQMDVDPAMAYVEIPSINVKMPIYHGTDESALMQGVGHLQGTSLPIGGYSSNCVISAHSGMSGERAFDDIRLLQSGDKVILHALGQTLAYQVTGSTVIEQTDIDAWNRQIAIRDGEDVVTLVTCTPYGVNDHRLIVRCERTEYSESDKSGFRAITHVNMRYVLLLMALILLILYAVILIIRGLVRNAREKRKGYANEQGQ